MGAGLHPPGPSRQLPSLSAPAQPPPRGAAPSACIARPGAGRAAPSCGGRRSPFPAGTFSTRSFDRPLCFGSRHRIQARRLPPVALASSDNDTEAEDAALEIERLERELEVAVRVEDYSAAACIRDRLRKLQESEEAAVIAANSLFYRAFQSRNMRSMRRVWARAEHVQCIHPGANCIQGYDMVMESWDLVLSGERRLNIDVESVRCYVRGSMAFVTCLEVLRSEGSSGRVIATNIFERKDGQWLLVLHQGATAPSGALF